MFRLKNALFSWNALPFHRITGEVLSDVRTLNTIRLATIVCFLKVNDCGLNLNTKLINLRLPDLDPILKSFP